MFGIGAIRIEEREVAHSHLRAFVPIIGFAVFLGAIVDQFTRNGAVGAALWVFGVAFVIGGRRRAIVVPTLAEVAGAAIALAGSAFIISERMGFAEMLAVASAWALVAPAVVHSITAQRREQILLAVTGGLALVVSLPSAINEVGLGAGIAMGAVVWVGGVLLIVAGMRSMIRTPVAA